MGPMAASKDFDAGAGGWRLGGADELTFRYRTSQFLSDHLAECSRIFDGDLQQMLILSLLCQAAAGARMRDLLRTNPDADCISASRLADISGIPRETVRRKLAALGSAGYVEQASNGAWRLSLDAAGRAPGSSRLEELERRSFELWNRLFAAMAPHLRENAAVFAGTPSVLASAGRD